MNSDFSDFVKELWHNKPIVIVLVMCGLIIFVLLVIDTYRHRKKQKEKHRTKHH